ncbi:MAG TPA: hypothetical protein PLI68_06565 [Bacteroidia bacterium]|nr:hypothetical protein [Bacteroidia bacterium]
MLKVPEYVSIVFSLTTFFSIYFFYRASQNSKTILLVLLVWMFVQALLAYSGFYTNTGSMPPRLIFGLLPTLISIAVLFSIPSGKHFIKSLSPTHLLLIHTLRLPVELVLYWLSLYKAVPVIMTFEGANYDIFSGISALVLLLLTLRKQPVSSSLLVGWNLVCLGLLATIVGIAVLSAPFPFQQLAFDQPNVAVLYFPFVWLPTVVVPLVLLAHLAALYQLLSKTKNPLP